MTLDQEQSATTPRPLDVILNGPNNDHHPANVILSDVMAAHRPSYIAQHQRRLVCLRRVIAIMSDVGSRFLRFDYDSDRWIVVDDLPSLMTAMQQLMERELGIGNHQ